MVYYIRFVKVPTVVAYKKNDTISEVTCSFDIRNDLAENLFTGPANLAVRLLGANPYAVLDEKELTWLGSEWTKEVRLRLPMRISSTHIHVQIMSKDKASLNIKNANAALPICAIQSANFNPKIGFKADSLAKRICFQTSYGISFAPWERVGPTIFGHIWDAGLLLAAHLFDIGSYLKRDAPLLSTPLAQLIASNQNKSTPLRVLELGSGIGIVSIALALAVPNCDVTPTDTEDANALLSLNVNEARSALTLLSTIKEPEILHWENVEHRRDIAAHSWDLILISDCTYNAGSVPSLVETISESVGASSALVVVALKRRHESEEIFYEKMDQVDLQVIRHSVLEIPDISRENIGLEPEEVEIYHFKRKGAGL